MGRLRRWGLPVALLAGSLGAGGTALALEADVPGPGEAVGGLRLATPVVSARRVPTVVAAPIAERRLLDDLSAWAAEQPPDTCLVVEGEEGAVRFDHRGDAPLVPASGAKLLTATAALAVLGDGHRFRTVASAAGPVDGPVLRGDLVLVGGGDPVLASPDYVAGHRRQPQLFSDLDQLAAQLAATGLTRVEGAVVGDEGRYDRARYVASWPERYIDQDQIGPLSALSVNDGFAAYPRAPDDPQELEPAADPAAEAAAVLTRLLEARGVEVVGEARSGTLPDGATELAVLESAPLDEIVAHLLQESDNNAAELLLKELGRTAGDPSTTGGAAVALGALAEAVPDPAAIVLADGSGLALENRATCAALLDTIAGDDPAPVLVDGLAVAGETGTLASRFAGTELEGVLRAKTGSLNSVTSLTGVVDDGDGPLAFSTIVNVPGGVVTAEVVAAQEDLGEVLRSYPRVPDVRVLGPEPPLGGAFAPGG